MRTPIRAHKSQTAHYIIAIFCTPTPQTLGNSARLAALAVKGLLGFLLLPALPLLLPAHAAPQSTTKRVTFSSQDSTTPALPKIIKQAIHPTVGAVTEKRLGHYGKFQEHIWIVNVNCAAVMVK